MPLTTRRRAARPGAGRPGGGAPAGRAVGEALGPVVVEDRPERRTSARRARCLREDVASIVVEVETSRRTLSLLARPLRARRRHACREVDERAGDRGARDAVDVRAVDELETPAGGRDRPVPRRCVAGARDVELADRPRRAGRGAARRPVAQHAHRRRRPAPPPTTRCVRRGVPDGVDAAVDADAASRGDPAGDAVRAREAEAQQLRARRCRPARAATPRRIEGRFVPIREANRCPRLGREAAGATMATGQRG